MNDVCLTNAYLLTIYKCLLTYNPPTMQRFCLFQEPGIDFWKYVDKAIAQTSLNVREEARVVG